MEPHHPLVGRLTRPASLLLPARFRRGPFGRAGSGIRWSAGPCGLGQDGMMAGQAALQDLTCVLQEMKAVGDLLGLRRPQRRSGGIVAAPVATDEPYLGTLVQPEREGCGVSVGQQIDDPMLVEIHQDRAIAAATTQGSGKGMVLPPFPPLRTGLVPFDTSGSSLSFRRCYPTGFLNSQSGRMELVMTRGMQQEAICHII